MSDESNDSGPPPETDKQEAQLLALFAHMERVWLAEQAAEQQKADERRFQRQVAEEVQRRVEEELPRRVQEELPRRVQEEMRRYREELRLRGVRYGTTKPDLDLASTKRRVGDQIRLLRMQSGLTAERLAVLVNEVIRAANPNTKHSKWTADTVSAVQTGRNRQVHLDELLVLARIFGVTVDDILTGAAEGLEVAIELPSRPQAPTADDLDVKVVKYVDEMPPFQAWVGQREEIEGLATLAGVKRNEMCRRLWAIAIPAYRKWLDQNGR